MPFRVALIGYGLAGAKFHGPLIAVEPDLQLTAIVTSNEERRAEARADHPGARLLASAAEIWSAPDAFDLVVIAAANRAHVALAHASIDAGVPVVVDKPLAATATEAREVVAHARTEGVPLTVFQNRRWDGDVLTLQRLLAAGELGAVHRFESRFERWRPEPKAGWRELGDPAEGGGVLLDLGSHLVDQALVLFGPATHVYAELDTRRATAQVEDDAFVAITHASGVRSHLWMSAVAPDLGPRMRVLGERGAYVKHGMDVQEDRLRTGERPDAPAWGVTPADGHGEFVAGDARRTVPTEPGDYTRFYAGVAAALRKEAPMPVDPADAVATLTVLDAARRSARPPAR
ncbi:MAG: Gfo/Idh/MocA family oxidoreductase [Solirubrobacteraceae bacterium]|nr:Gfo/Idh/MocA family oxidoreductase [Solirubrobacteraceae bacterium]